MIFKTHQSKNTSSYLGIVSLFIFVIWLLLVANHTYFISLVDQTITPLFRNNSILHFQNIIILITYLGNPTPMTVLTGLTLIFLWVQKKYQLSLFVLISSLSVLITNLLIKSWIARPRPSLTHLVNASGFSFPSGHAMNSLFLFGIFYLIYKNYLPHSFQLPFKIFCALMPLLIGLSRISVGVHYPSDIIGGFLLALAGIGLFHYLANKKTYL